jgi:hypothetical protein
VTDTVIAKAVADATIHAPVGSIDLAEWVFTLTDSEYQACSRNHIAALRRARRRVNACPSMSSVSAT